MDNNYLNNQNSIQGGYVSQDNQYTMQYNYQNATGYQYNQYQQSGTCAEEYNKKRININMILRIVSAIMALLIFLAPTMTFNKIEFKDVTLKFDMYELIDLTDVLENDNAVNNVIDYYVENNSDIESTLEEASDIVGTLFDTLDDYDMVADVIEFLTPIPVSTITEFVGNASGMLSSIVDALQSDTNQQCLEMYNILTTQKTKLIIIIALLYIFSIINIVLIIFDKNIFVAILSIFEIITYFVMTTAFKYGLIGMGMGVHIVLIASIFQLAIGVTGFVMKKRNKAQAMIV